MRQCPHCDGYGKEPGGATDLEHGEPLCEVCHGTGEVTPLRYIRYMRECERAARGGYDTPEEASAARRNSR